MSAKNRIASATASPSKHRRGKEKCNVVKNRFFEAKLHNFESVFVVCDSKIRVSFFEPKEARLFVGIYNFDCNAMPAEVIKNGINVYK